MKTKMPQIDYPLVYVEWEDSLVGTAGWGFTDGAKPSVMVCRSVGWLVYDGKDSKLVVPHLSESGHSVMYYNLEKTDSPQLTPFGLG